MPEEAVYNRTFKLLTNDVDFQKRARPSGILNIFQEIAGTHAEQLGVGFHEMSARGMFWVLSRMKYEVLRCPQYEQEVIATTWPVQTGAVYFERDYELTDSKSGEILVRGTSVWCVLSSETHALIPAKNVDILHVNFLTRRAMPEKIGKIQAGKEPLQSTERLILPGDLDFNLHVNNTRYADFIYDCFDLEYLARHDLRSLQVHYLKEGKCGETLRLTRSACGENAYFINGAGVDGEPVFCGQAIFN